MKAFSKQKKHRRLGFKALSGFFILALVLIIFISATVGMQYYNDKMNEYSATAYSYSRTAAEYIDGDKILTYLETNEEDDYYNQIKAYLTSVQSNSDIEYYYVFVPFEDDLVYIWDVGNPDGVKPLGWHEGYLDGGKEVLNKIYKQNPEEEISIARDDVYGYIASAYSPVFDNSGNPVAVVGVDLSMPGIETALFRFLAVIIISVIVVIVVSMFVFYRFISKNIIRPISRLNEASKNMVSNLEDETVFNTDIHTGDEIEELSDSFSQMDAELRAYLKKLSSVTAEKERIGAELDIARHIQSSMLPCIFPPFPERKDFDIFASMNPAKEVGGDFYDFFMVDERHIAIVMADVSGKGVPAALFMVIGKTLIKDHTQPGISLGTVFSKVNQLLCDSNSEDMFITAFEGVLDLVTGELTYVNAGHEPPYIYKGDGFEPQKIRAGLVLAGMENMRYHEGSIQLAPGDKIFLYTDGITEATNAENELYGSKRLQNALNRSMTLHPSEILSAVKEDVDSFVGDAPQFDDMTMLCLDFKRIMKTDTTETNIQEITTEATIENIEKVTDFVNELLDEACCPMKVQMQLDIVIDELFGNIAHYAYKDGTGNATVRVELPKAQTEVYLTFIDNGIPYNPLEQAAPDTTLSADERKVGGLGIFIVKNSVDDISYEYRDGQNILTIRKAF